jgi:dTDP-4-dehydrorhamnose reductase
MARIRVAVTGTKGQVVRSLVERAAAHHVDVVTLGRPLLDLADSRTLEPAIASAGADIVVNAAAMTDTEQAEVTPEIADAVNGEGAAALAACARRIGIPIIQVSTECVFDGNKTEPYRESDTIAPLSVYGRSKAAGEAGVAAAHPEHAILRVVWVYSSFGRNFVTTLLNLAKKQGELRVVYDQCGNPTAASDIADGILSVAGNLINRRTPEQFGIFHMAAEGAATRLQLAEEIFAISEALGGPTARVLPVKAADYPSRVRRPVNSQLECTKIAAIHGVKLPPWQASLRACIARILEQRP